MVLMQDDTITITGQTADYQVSVYRQTCTCIAGQFGRRCRHLADAEAAANFLTEAQRDAELMRQAMAAGRRNSFSRNDYPGTD